MRRRLLAAFAVVLVVGALLDATVHRDVTGAELPTVGEREAARAEATDVVFERTVPTLLGEVLDRGAIDGRFALYVALRERAPGATVLLDEASTASALPAVYLRVLAAAGDVRPFDAAGADAPVGPPSVSGTFRNGPWALHLDRGTVAEVLIFERGGTMLACGVDGAVDVFDVTRPGRSAVMRAETRSRDDLDGGGQRGLVSCVDACPTENHLFCAGSYAGGRDAIDCGVYDARAEGGRACSWSARGGGVTQVRWSVDGNFIYTASRRSDDILCVDVRNTLGVVYALKRAARGTNQRIRFDLEPCGAHLVTGGVDGFVRAFDLRTGEEVGRTQVSPNGACVNAVSFHPYSCAVAGSSEKFRRLACVVGERVFVDVSGDDSDSDVSDVSDAIKWNDFGVSFWDYPTIEASWA